jgi:hypothetical protein
LLGAVDGWNFFVIYIDKLFVAFSVQVDDFGDVIVREICGV